MDLISNDWKHLLRTETSKKSLLKIFLFSLLQECAIPEKIQTGGLRTWNFQGYWRKRMWNFQWSIKKKWNFQGCSRKAFVEFPWVVGSDLGISKWCHTILQNFLNPSPPVCIFSGISQFRHSESERFSKTF